MRRPTKKVLPPTPTSCFPPSSRTSPSRRLRTWIARPRLPPPQSRFNRPTTCPFPLPAQLTRTLGLILDSVCTYTLFVSIFFFYLLSMTYLRSIFVPLTDSKLPFLFLLSLPQRHLHTPLLRPTCTAAPSVPTLMYPALTTAITMVLVADSRT